jgi:hypothetical protein
MEQLSYIHTYIPLTLYPRRGSRGISDIPLRHPRFTKISKLWIILQTWQVVSPSPSSCSLSQVLSMEEREKCYSFILSQTPHETNSQIFLIKAIHTHTCIHTHTYGQRHVKLYLQFDISANGIRAVQSSKVSDVLLIVYTHTVACIGYQSWYKPNRPKQTGLNCLVKAIPILRLINWYRNIFAQK